MWYFWLSFLSSFQMSKFCFDHSSTSQETSGVAVWTRLSRILRSVQKRSHQFWILSIGFFDDKGRRVLTKIDLKVICRAFVQNRVDVKSGVWRELYNGCNFSARGRQDLLKVWIDVVSAQHKVPVSFPCALLYAPNRPENSCTAYIRTAYNHTEYANPNSYSHSKQGCI